LLSVDDGLLSVSLADQSLVAFTQISRVAPTRVTLRLGADGAAVADTEREASLALQAARLSHGAVDAVAGRAVE